MNLKSLLIKIPGCKYLLYLKYKFKYKNFKLNMKVMPIEETLHNIKEKKLSIIRLGDGEIQLLKGNGLYFQNNNSKFICKFKDIIENLYTDNGILLCFPDVFINDNLYKKDIALYWYYHFFTHKEQYIKFISYDYKYGNSFISRPYIMFKNKNKCGFWFDELKSIWENKDITIIEGEKSRLGVGNDLFDKASSIERILCPSKNAFDKYEEILKESLKTDKNRLILVSLGPTAKVLVYDLYKAGYWAIDIGHIDSEYEWYLRGAKDKIKIKGKHTAENIFEDLESIEDSEDKDYISQIRVNICR